MAYIHLYTGNPTAGGTDGTQVSESTELTPVTVGPLNGTTGEESAAIKLALRCETGYQTSGDTTVQPVGTNADKWALAPDNAGSPGTWGAWGGTLTISSVIGTTNSIIWAKSRAVAGETPQNDASVDLTINATIVAA
jgi:hypothetical protein